jgi:hypothetical protein
METLKGVALKIKALLCGGFIHMRNSAKTESRKK